MYRLINEKMGKDKGCILKAKYIDVKKISADIEEELKSKYEKSKQGKKGQNVIEFSEKIEQDTKHKYRGFGENNASQQTVNSIVLLYQSVNEEHTLTDTHIIIKDHNPYFYRLYHHFSVKFTHLESSLSNKDS